MSAIVVFIFWSFPNHTFRRRKHATFFPHAAVVHQTTSAYGKKAAGFVAVFVDGAVFKCRMQFTLCGAEVFFFISNAFFADPFAEFGLAVGDWRHAKDGTVVFRFHLIVVVHVLPLKGEALVFLRLALAFFSGHCLCAGVIALFRIVPGECVALLQ